MPHVYRHQYGPKNIKYPEAGVMGGCEGSIIGSTTKLRVRRKGSILNC